MAIIARDEADRIGNLLKSLSFADEIVVVDSGSTDGTQDICQEAGARVITNAWPGYVAQKQFALEAAKHEWILCLDADEEIPAELDDWQGGKIFIEILKQLEEEMELNSDFRDSLAKSIACKASIKAGKKLTRKEMLNLINQLFACQMPYFCPHGRPLILKMTLTEFEKKFKRQL